MSTAPSHSSSRPTVSLRAANDNCYLRLVPPTENPVTARCASLTRRSPASILADRARRVHAYDGMGQLTRETVGSNNWVDLSYEYDSIANLRLKQNANNNTSITFTHDAKNRLTLRDHSSAADISLAYDNRGNAVSYGGQNFVYDLSNQPVSISGTANGTYRYDGHKRRVKSVVDGKTIYNVYNAAGTLTHIDKATDGETTDYVGSMARVTNNITTYLHKDHVGSAVAGTSQNGLVNWREQYAAHGHAFVRPLPNDDRDTYTGHIRDKATGLTYMQARYYQHKVNRFLSIDPIGFSVGNTGMFNRYAYVGNDPVNATDPTGKNAARVAQKILQKVAKKPLKKQLRKALGSDKADLMVDLALSGGEPGEVAKAFGSAYGGKALDALKGAKLFRGSKKGQPVDFTPRENVDFKVAPDGTVVPGRGLSVVDDPKTLHLRWSC